jgi:hypothetical protein
MTLLRWRRLCGHRHGIRYRCGARESADVVLLGNDLLRLVEVLRIARRRRIILTNFTGALLVDGATAAYNPMLLPVIHTGIEWTCVGDVGDTGLHFSLRRDTIS